MKKIPLIAVLFFMLNTFAKAQTNLFICKASSIIHYKPGNSRYFFQEDSNVRVKKEYYLRKSKNQKTAAWVLLSGGTLLMGAGLLIGNRNESSFGEAAAGIFMGGLGFLSMIGSIPLFIASQRNKVKAKLTIGFQRKSPQMSKHIPSIGLKIPLG